MGLWIARHPRVVVSSAFCYGASDVLAQTDHVQKCALQLAKALPQACQLRTSQRQRTWAVAQALQQLRTDLPTPISDALLNEMDFGVWEMIEWERIPTQAIDTWVENFPHHRFGGNESVSDVIQRAHQALNQYKSQMQEASNTHNECWITHAGIIKSIAFLQSNPDGQIDSAAQWPATSPAYGTVKRLAI